MVMMHQDTFNGPIQTPQNTRLGVPLTFLFSNLRECIQGVDVLLGTRRSRHALGRMAQRTPSRDDGNAKVLSYGDTCRCPGAQTFIGIHGAHRSQSRRLAFVSRQANTLPEYQLSFVSVLSLTVVSAQSHLASSERSTLPTNNAAGTCPAAVITRREIR